MILRRIYNMIKITTNIYKHSMKVLKFISLNRRTVHGGETFCPFSQLEMAEILNLSEGKVSRSIKHLSRLGYIEKEPKKYRKYKITESGRNALKKVKK